MKDNILKIMLVTILLNVVVICISVFSKSTYALSLTALGSFSNIISLVVPFWLFSRIVDDEEYRKIASFGSVFALITTVVSALNTLNVINSGEFMAKVVILLNVVVWILAILAYIFSVRSVNGIVDLLKKLGVFLTIIIGLFLIVYLLTGSVSDGFMLKLVYALLVTAIGVYISIFVSARFYKREITELELNERDFRNNNNQNIQNNVINQAIANTVASHKVASAPQQENVSQVSEVPTQDNTNQVLEVQSQSNVTEPVVESVSQPTPNVTQDLTINNNQQL